LKKSGKIGKSWKKWKNIRNFATPENLTTSPLPSANSGVHNKRGDGPFRNGFSDFYRAVSVFFFELVILGKKKEFILLVCKAFKNGG